MRHCPLLPAPDFPDSVGAGRLVDKLFIMAKTFLLTGAAGFIGSNTAERLLRQGHRVVGFDNLCPVYSVDKKRYNLRQIQLAAAHEGQFVFIEGDLRDLSRLQKLFADFRLDGVIHLAALAGVQPSIAAPLDYAEVNVRGTLHILEAARHAGVRSLVLASSSSVYGANEKLPFCELDPVDRPISPYAATKRCGELFAHAYARLYELRIACLRFFTVYGPRQRPDLAIYKFVRAMLRDQEITVYGDGSSQRDYTYIDDCVDGIQRAAQWTLNGAPGAACEIFNLGEAQSVSLTRVVSLLETYLGRRAKICHAGYLPGDVLITHADIGHARQVLDYRPGTSIETGLEKFCRWYVEEESRQAWAQ